MLIRRKWSRSRHFLGLPGLRTASVLAATLLGMVAIQEEALAQGQVRWGNSFTGVVRAPVYGVDPANPYLWRSGNTPSGLPAGTQTYGGALLEGTGFTIAMFFGNDPQPRGVNTFRTGAAAGLTTLLTLTDPSRPPGTTGFNVQFRVWDNQGGSITSWVQVMARLDVAGGCSDPFTIGPLGGVLGPNVFPVPDTTGIRSFNITALPFCPIPEPSLIALGALSLGALLLRRRR